MPPDVLSTPPRPRDPSSDALSRALVCLHRAHGECLVDHRAGVVEQLGRACEALGRAFPPAAHTHDGWHRPRCQERLIRAMNALADAREDLDALGEDPGWLPNALRAIADAAALARPAPGAP